MRTVLLVEPAYKAKYPPLGLMKISAYHKLLGDNVVFVRGKDKELRKRLWDRIYVTSLFTFHFKTTADTINFYKTSTRSLKDVYVGGIAASLVPQAFFDETGIYPHQGLLDKPGVLDKNDIIIDQLVPDYSILNEIDYVYPCGNSYVLYSTRGCINHCEFCAVPVLEPTYKDYLPFKDQISQINELYGEKQTLLLLDNNLLASHCFDKIVDELKEAGFGVGSTFTPSNILQTYTPIYKDRAKMNTLPATIRGRIVDELLKIKVYLRPGTRDYDFYYDTLDKYGAEKNLSNTTDDVLFKIMADMADLYEKKRRKNKRVKYVDFNQGIDARLLDDTKMARLSELNVHPMRIAFDSISYKDIYTSAIRLAKKYNIKAISNYILYNFKDKPEDLYERLRINVDLNRELGLRIFSFPMRYAPVYRLDRSYIGEHWAPKQLKSIYKILNVTKGIVAANDKFFRHAFGETLNDYYKILLLPEKYILQREDHEKDGSIDKLWENFARLKHSQKQNLIDLIKNMHFDRWMEYKNDPLAMSIIDCYEIELKQAEKRIEEQLELSLT